MKKYKIIYADPPWETKNFKETKEGKISRPLPYPTLTDEQIIGLPIGKLAEDNAILFLWVIDSRVPKIAALMESWGFSFKCVGFVWAKKAKTTDGYNAGFSSYTRRTCEFCFIGTRGKYIVRKKNLEQLVQEVKGRHSEKPAEIRNLIVEMCGDLPRIELFAREKTEGWDVWGNEVESNITL